MLQEFQTAWTAKLGIHGDLTWVFVVSDVQIPIMYVEFHASFFSLLTAGAPASSMDPRTIKNLIVDLPLFCNNHNNVMIIWL